jgi:rod shape-determining protein MreD
MGVVAAFWIGLVADIVFGAPFGFHGLNYALLAALVLSSYQQLRMLEIWQQALLILFALELLTVLQLVVVGVIDDRDQSWLILLRPLTSALVWPWVFLLLRAYRRRYV